MEIYNYGETNAIYIIIIYLIERRYFFLMDTEQFVYDCTYDCTNDFKLAESKIFTIFSIVHLLTGKENISTMKIYFII